MSCGTGVLLSYGGKVKLLSAAHIFCCKDCVRNTSYTVKLQDGREFPLDTSKLFFSEKYQEPDSGIKFDVAVASVPELKDLVTVELATKRADDNDALQLGGYGGSWDCKLRLWTATAHHLTDSDRIVDTVGYVPGDSGGPVFHDGKLVGIISHGFIVGQEKVLNSDYPDLGIVFPGGATSVKGINRALTEHAKLVK